ncbi:Glycoside hydrolase, superfamily [Niveomyces insectorum RCEF 264]|uniref:Glycoside hydrolase, superfamily n=1 Tax=Niveomyces insectorum RCEF 264 TaxID=1081102 RepID=A0A162MQA1_9HYPO|nr:Glycoside hydrolase, superfamily [Niveomyces insectorum RCEF 264]
MRVFNRTLPLLALSCLCSGAGASTITSTSTSTSAAVSRSAKRGLAFTPNATWPQDNYLWTRSPSDLTWYYNYGASPSPVYSNLSQDVFAFVPMLWGGSSSRTSDTTFLATVTGLLSHGIEISHVLTFNEPDLSTDYGGSDVDPMVAAKIWVANIIPLQATGVKVGLPACSGGWGAVPWLSQFLGNCSKLISTDGSGGVTRNCTYDFIPLHWYGNFEGLASHIGTYAAAFPNATFWVTEFNDNDQDLATTQSFFNTSIEYLDRLAHVERYSFFGAFRSTASNVGPNAAMLSAGGKLTDIGAWYLGEAATGVVPDSGTSSPAIRRPGSSGAYIRALLTPAFACALLLVSVY